MLEATNGQCFACGERNPIGLRLTFRFEGEGYVTEFTPRDEHQGYDGITHGGLIATVLDETMARMLWARGLSFATAELVVRYREPLPVGSTMTVRAAIVRQTSRFIEMTADGLDPLGKLIASGRGRFLRVGTRGGEPDG